MAVNDPNLDVIIAVYAILLSCVSIVGLTVGALVCYLLSSTARALPESYRNSVSPVQAFFLLIPFFNLYWVFVYPKRLSEAYQDYFRSAGVEGQGDCGEQHAQWWAICSIAAIIPCLGILIGIAGLVFLVMFLVAMLECKKIALSGPHVGSGTSGIGPDESNPYQP